VEGRDDVLFHPLCPLLLVDDSQLDVSFASLFDFFKILDLLV
jgi:hypothetical protein